MDDLRTILDNLEDAKLDYVWERSRARSDAEAIRKSGISRSTFYSWSKEERTRLNGYAQELKRRRKLVAELYLEEAVEEAAKVKVAGLKSRKEHIRQAVATEILDRTVGKPAQPITGEGGGAILIRVDE